MSSRNKRQKIEQINLEFIPLPEDIPPPPEPPPKLEQDDFRDHTQHQAASPRTTCIKTETSTSTTTRNRSQKRQHSLSPVPSPPPLPPIPADEIPVPSEIPSPPKPEPKLEPRSSIKIETEGEIAIMEENPEETDLMAKILGFSSFNSTKGKQVPGNQVGAVHVVKKRKYRQYMNRKGGFNRPLDKVP